ncbi:MAG TPA: alpha/beta hydrolase [Anaerolineae bacterium]|nr:alpha/beta hydrolase [Anaerolineae bacterium]
MADDSLPAGLTATVIDTPRLKTRVLSRGPERGVPVIFVHGNISSARHWEETLLALPPAYWGLAPDLRGFGHSDTKPVDATRGLGDFADDLYALVESLGLGAEGRQTHWVGWSMGGGIVMRYALDHPEQVASLVLVSPMGPYGFGGTKDERGTPCWPDYAGSGAGAANPEFVKRLAVGDRREASPFSPRQVLHSHFFKAPFRPTPEREEVLLSGMLETKVGEANYPGEVVRSAHWPGIAPGSTGVVNAMSPKYCNLSGFAQLRPQPPVLWVRGDSDRMVSDTSTLDFGYLGQLGLVAGWPGPAVYPPQPMVSQLRVVLEAYRAQGGPYHEAVIPNCGHTPYIEKPTAFRRLIFDFLDQPYGNDGWP